jgi:hypothetical protein
MPVGLEEYLSAAYPALEQTGCGKLAKFALHRALARCRSTHDLAQIEFLLRVAVQQPQDRLTRFAEQRAA